MPSFLGVIFISNSIVYEETYMYVLNLYSREHEPQKIKLRKSFTKSRTLLKVLKIAKNE